MSKAEFVPAIGEQLNSVWKRGLKYKEFDMKFFTENSHYEHNIALQSCYYGMNGVGRKEDRSYRDIVGYPKDKLLITDSGGFQLATFRKRGEVCNLSPIDSLRWQERNADIGMNLDVPSTLSKVPTYEEFGWALRESQKNFELFEKERKNFTFKLYNVLHGENISLLEKWYNGVKHFKFDGWAIGMKPPSDPMIQALGFLFLWEKGELKKDNKFGVHFFGTSGKHVVPTIVYCANKLNEKKVTYDSSSYNIGSIYRTYYLPFDIGPTLSFGDKFNRVNKHITLLPCTCPVCRSITSYEELNGTDIYAGALISLHNLYQYIIYNNVLNSLVSCKEKFLEYLQEINISKKTLISIEFVDFAIENGLYNAVKKYELYLIPQETNMCNQKTIFDV